MHFGFMSLLYGVRVHHYLHDVATECSEPVAPLLTQPAACSRCCATEPPSDGYYDDL